MSCLIGMQDGYITYIKTFDTDNLSEILHKHYRCPKKVKKMISLGSNWKVKESVDDIVFRPGFNQPFGKSYGGLEAFLLNTGYVAFLFKNGTWYVGNFISRQKDLLSKCWRDYV